MNIVCTNCNKSMSRVGAAYKCGSCGNVDSTSGVSPLNRGSMGSVNDPIIRRGGSVNVEHPVFSGPVKAADLDGVVIDPGVTGVQEIITKRKYAKNSEPSGPVVSGS